MSITNNFKIQMELEEKADLLLEFFRESGYNWQNDKLNELYDSLVKNSNREGVLLHFNNIT